MKSFQHAFSVQLAPPETRKQQHHSASGGFLHHWTRVTHRWNILLQLRQALDKVLAWFLQPLGRIVVNVDILLRLKVRLQVRKWVQKNQTAEWTYLTRRNPRHNARETLVTALKLTDTFLTTHLTSGLATNNMPNWRPLQQAVCWNNNYDCLNV